MSLSFILIIPLITLKILEPYLFPLVFLTILSFYTFWKMTHTQTNKKYENTSAWALMYTTYFIYAMGFALLTILST
jgi:hypothetical protein